jgi:hypothetical protein
MALPAQFMDWDLLVQQYILFHKPSASGWEF